MILTSVNFVLGAAGTGKTYGFIEAARANLLQKPEGAPLLFLTPKQATFQIESELSDARLQGFTRLQILSFSRLAEFVLNNLKPNSAQMLSETGRVMILRSLLDHHVDKLKSFQNAADPSSFAEAIAGLLSDFQKHKIGEKELREMAKQSRLSRALRSKLEDLALLSQAYREWLERAKLKDSEFLLALATECLHALSPQSAFYIETLWLDGFSEMTPQELALLLAILRHTRRANLAFCLDPKDPSPSSWLDLWATTSELYQKCRSQIASLENVAIHITRLTRKASTSRFISPALQHLEAAWNAAWMPRFSAHENHQNFQDIQILRCLSREEEVLCAARILIRFVREERIRYRETMVIVRNLEHYAASFRRIFSRYQIPHFIDTRLPIGHHPALLLTRSALRIVALDWQSEDCLSALKTGLIASEDIAICELENTAIQQGWSANQWKKGIASLECFHKKTAEPFAQLAAELLDDSDSNALISGKNLVKSIRSFWENCDLEKRLDDWTDQKDLHSDSSDSSAASIHSGIWEPLQIWLNNVELAFSNASRSLREWLPILENGIARLSVGVIPPTTDQVLIGSIDRTRSPNVKLALVLGLNEGVFPASLPIPSILTEAERSQIAQKFPLSSKKRSLAAERFYGYIACTRAAQRLVLSFAERDEKGKSLVPSSLIGHLRHLFPDIQERRFSADLPIDSAQHASELIAPFFKTFSDTGTFPAWTKQVPSLDSNALERICKTAETSPCLHEGLARLLYLDASNVLRSSVSRLEQFAACPFRFFIHSGLRATEREPFQIDPKRLGSLEHSILENFHNQIVATGRKWREVPFDEARERIQQIAKNAAAQLDRGIFNASPEGAFWVETIVERLGEFVSIGIQWMRQYEFDPMLAELSFGIGDSMDAIPAWKVSLDSGTLAFVGKIDRLDIHPIAQTSAAEAVIIDYKSSGKRLDPLLLHHGIQLQLLAYLNVVSQVPQIAKHLGLDKLKPAGVFFVPLRGKVSRQSNRNKAEENRANRPRSFQHLGCFDFASLRLLDNRPDQTHGDQIRYRLKKDGSPMKTAWYEMQTETFRETMQRTEESVRAMGNRILKGDVQIDPYIHAGNTACLYCPYPSICRIDAAKHSFRILSKPKSKESI